jgi:serine/threonine-protein kinase
MPEHGPRLTQQGTLVGTPHYMAPERLLGAESDASADIYAVGVMLYEMLSGRAPFVGPTLGEVIAAVLRDTPPPLAALCPHVSAPLIDIVRSAMQRDPSARYPSAEAMLQALNQIDSTLQGEISSPRIVPPVRSVAPSSLRTPALLDFEEEDDLLYRRLSRRGRWQMPLVLAAGLAVVIWAAWPSAVHERGEHQPGYVASDGQPSTQPGQQAAAGQPSPAEPRREPDPLMANAPLASEPVQGAALVEGSSELVPADPNDPANSGAGGEGIEGNFPELGPDPFGAAEPVINTQPQLAPSAQGSRAKRATHEDAPVATHEDVPAQELEPRPTASGYQPVRAVPLQPLLDRIDHMLKEPPASAPSGENPAAPPRRSPPEGLPDNPY